MEINFSRWIQPMRSRKVIDLTKQLDQSLANFRSGGYSDPPFRCLEWCSVAEQGFRVSRVELGTQTGTHIDAPAHFSATGDTLDALPIEDLIGPYFLLDLHEPCHRSEMLTRSATYAQESILFIRTERGLAARVPPDALAVLINLPCRVWVLAGEIVVENAPGYEFYRTLAKAGKFLIEDVATEAAAWVPARGEIIALPLRLMGTSGAPCRVVVRTAADADSDAISQT